MTLRALATPRLLGAAIAGLVAVGSVAAVAKQPEGDTSLSAADGGESSGSVDRVDPRSFTLGTGEASTTTTEAPTTTTTGPAPTTVPAPPPAPSGSGAPPPAEPSTGGAAVRSQGVYVLDAVSGSVRRLADRPYPFDVAGSSVLIAKGLDVYAAPVAGGDAVRRYRMSKSPVFQDYATKVDLSRERIVFLEAAPDGRATVTAGVPTRDGNGWMINTRIVGPTGAVLLDNLDTHETEWSDDGERVALYDWRGISIHRADGTAVRTLAVEDYRDLRWMADGSALLGVANSGAAVRRINTTSGATAAVAGLTEVADPGPGGRIAGVNSRSQAPDEFSSPGIGVYDPGTNATRPVVSSGSWTSWSLGGSRLAVLDRPVWRPGDPEGPRQWHLRVHSTGGALQHKVMPAPGLSLPFVHERSGPSWAGPQWSGDRYVAFVVTATGADAMDVYAR